MILIRNLDLGHLTKFTLLLPLLIVNYCVSPSLNNWVLGFIRLGLNLRGLGPVGTLDWGLGLELDNK